MEDLRNLQQKQLAQDAIVEAELTQAKQSCATKDATIKDL